VATKTSPTYTSDATCADDEYLAYDDDCSDDDVIVVPEEDCEEEEPEEEDCEEEEPEEEDCDDEEEVPVSTKAPVQTTPALSSVKPVQTQTYGYIPSYPVVSKPVPTYAAAIPASTAAANLQAASGSSHIQMSVGVVAMAAVAALFV
ncbi:hypothetical protein HK101_002782, partial [Irineochytrium annulatum]